VSRASARRSSTRSPAEEGAAFLADVVWGLSQPHKAIPCKWLYDRRGSLLFDRICELDAYYVTRTETAITRAHAAEIAELVGPRARLVELGSGSSSKTRILLDRMRDLGSYVPVDISREHLVASARRLGHEYPELTIVPLVADYSRSLDLPARTRGARRTIVYFPGSTLGNFEPDDAARFLRAIAEHAAPDGALLVGIDLAKDPDVVARAYDDPDGVTAEFNRNLLWRIRVELGGELDPHAFRHRAPYDAVAGRVEMQLVSDGAQAIRVAGREFALHGSSSRADAQRRAGPTRGSTRGRALATKAAPRAKVHHASQPEAPSARANIQTSSAENPTIARRARDGYERIAASIMAIAPSNTATRPSQVAPGVPTKPNTIAPSASTTSSGRQPSDEARARAPEARDPADARGWGNGMTEVPRLCAARAAARAAADRGPALTTSRRRRRTPARR
jgi:L-histidine N-alpha-methyltransferase